MTKNILIATLVVAAATVIFYKDEIGCSVGSSVCLVSGGVTFTPKKAQETMDACDDVTHANAGSVAVKMSLDEVSNEHEKYGLSPVVSAYYSLNVLYKSKLKFERQWEKLDYAEIKRECARFRRDFYNNSRWK